VKQRFSLLLLSVALLAAAESRHDLFRVRRATDLARQTRRLGEAPATKAVVFIFLGPECPISQRYVPKLNRLAAAQDTNAVEFFGVIAGQSMTRTQAIAFAKEYAIQFPVLFDDGLALARWLRPTHMPEAFVLQRDGDVVYHGRIDDWYESPGKPRAAAQHHELRDALIAVVAGKSPPRIYAPPVGCYFEDWPAR
jgi:thiol-disulfide isomerase/thioredoxin